MCWASQKVALFLGVTKRSAKSSHRDKRWHRFRLPGRILRFRLEFVLYRTFGGHDAARRAVQEMGRVVRPEGIVAIATEMLLLEERSYPEFFTRSQIKNELIEPCAGTLELISDINFDTLTYDYLVDSIVLP